MMATASKNIRRATIAVIALIALAAILYGFVVLRDSGRFVLATNSAGPAVPGLKLAAKKPVCVSDLFVPSDTRAVRFHAVPDPGIHANLKVTVRLGDKIQAVSSRYRYDGKRAYLPIAVAPVSTAWKGGLKTVCIESVGSSIQLLVVTPTGSIVESAAVVGAVPTVTSGGRTVAQEPRVDLLSGPNLSAWSQIGKVLHRASLFRPGWVGPWTYYILFALLLMTAGGALVLFVKFGRGGLPDRRWVIAIALVTVVNGFAWSIVTPAFHVPDEQEHFAYIDTLANRGMPNLELGKPPGAFTKRFNLFLDTAFRNIALYPESKPPWEKFEERRWRAADQSLRSDDGTASGLSSAAQYSPLYYGVAVAPYKLAGKDIVLRNWFVRLLSVFMTAVGAACAFMAARRIAPGVAWFAPTTGLIVAFQPMYLHMGSAAHPDAMLNMFGSVLILLGVIILRSGLTARRAVECGVLIAVMYLVKPTAVGFLPAIVFVFLLAALRDQGPVARRVGRVILGGFFAIAIVGVASWVFHSSAGTVGDLTDGQGVAPFTAGGMLSNIWQWFLPPLSFMYDWHPHGWLDMPPIIEAIVPGFVAAFNHLDTLFGESFYDWVKVIVLVMFAVLPVVAYRERASLRSSLPVVAFVALSVAGVVFFLLVSAYLLLIDSGGWLLQGRYLLPLIAVFGMFVATASLVVGRRWGMVIASGFIAAVALLNIFSLGLSLSRFYL